MLDATSPLGVATHAHNSDQPRAPKTIDTYAEALRADGLIDLVAGGTKSVRSVHLLDEDSPHLRPRAGVEKLAQLASECGAARNALVSLVACPWATKNRARAQLALNLVRSFEIKSCGNELADHLHCSEPYSPPSVLSSPSLHHAPSALPPAIASPDLEVEALGLPWGASASCLLPSPPPADGGLYLPLEEPSGTPSLNDLTLPLMFVPSRSDDGEPGSMLAAGLASREQQLHDVAHPNDPSDGIGREPTPWPLVPVNATSVLWADDAPSACVSSSADAENGSMGGASSDTALLGTASTSEPVAVRRSKRPRAALAHDAPQRHNSGRASVADAFAEVGEPPLLPRQAHALDEISDDLLRSFGLACGDQHDGMSHLYEGGAGAGALLMLPPPPVAPTSLMVRAAPPPLLAPSASASASGCGGAVRAAKAAAIKAMSHEGEPPPKEPSTALVPCVDAATKARLLADEQRQQAAREKKSAARKVASAAAKVKAAQVKAKKTTARLAKNAQRASQRAAEQAAARANESKAKAQASAAAARGGGPEASTAASLMDLVLGAPALQPAHRLARPAPAPSAAKAEKIMTAAKQPATTASGSKLSSAKLPKGVRSKDAAAPTSVAVAHRAESSVASTKAVKTAPERKTAAAASKAEADADGEMDVAAEKSAGGECDEVDPDLPTEPVASKNNPSGYKGVYPARNGRWQAQVHHSSIGGFATKREAGIAVAIAVYREKKKKHAEKAAKKKKHAKKRPMGDHATSTAASAPASKKRKGKA